MITPQLLLSAVGCSRALADTYAGPLSEACALFEINTRPRLAAFLAQVGHESGAFRHVREIASGQAYEGRRDLGNTEPGDGVRFCGHGLIQVTGRANHREMRPLLMLAGYTDAPDFESDPEALMQPRWAAASAAAYWHSRGMNELADRGEFERITRRINGGLNGHADRLARWLRAKGALAAASQDPPAAPHENLPPVQTPAPGPHRIEEVAETVSPNPQETVMPLPAFIAAALPAVIEAIPKLGRLFGSGSEVSERNIKAAELAVEIVRDATGAANAQQAVELVQTSPDARAAAVRAIEQRWLELDEAGGGGIDGARRADGAMARSGDVLRSPSFWIGLALLPLVYLLVLSLIGLIGSATWSDDVRAGLAGSLISAIVGGLIGYYFGQTTSRNRTPAP